MHCPINRRQTWLPEIVGAFPHVKWHERQSGRADHLWRDLNFISWFVRRPVNHHTTPSVWYLNRIIRETPIRIYSVKLCVHSVKLCVRLIVS